MGGRCLQPPLPSWWACICMYKNHPRHLYWFPVASITLPSIWWLKTRKNYSLIILEPRSLESSFWQGHAYSEGSRGDSVPCSSSFWWLQTLFGFWLHHSDLCCHLHTAPSSLFIFFSVWNSLWLCLISTLVMVFKVYLDKDNQVNLLILWFLITYKKIIFSNEVTFTCSRDYNLISLGGYFST